ncbi:MAG: TIGR04282 family arsenosugar biosynthesis glycosyltransferase [Planctomycetota bacterium]|jgi:rSAM/selenodomain-associated transferase 1
MSNQNDKCILFFAKYPEAGRVKTRLAADIGPDAAAQIYKNFIEDLLFLLENLNVNLKFYFGPPDTEAGFSKWLGKKYCFKPQIGDNLGKILKNAFDDAFQEDFSNVVAIGSDSPDLPEDYINLGFHALGTHDVALGPANDGGYYLIGFTKDAFSAQAFEHITWSADTVFDQTLNILKQHRRSVYILPQWHDVDTLDDLKSLLSRNENTPFRQSRTFCCLTTGKLRSTLNV